jgi:hypothetical protein
VESRERRHARCLRLGRWRSRGASQKPWRDRRSGSPSTMRGASQRSESRETGGSYRGPPVPPVSFGMPHSQGKWGMLLRPKREIPPPKRSPLANPPPAPNRGGQNRGGRGRGGAARPQPPRRQLLPNSGGIPGLLQSPGSLDPTQRLALMMAVMLLGMPPVHSCLTNTGSEASGGGNRLEPKTYPPVLTRESKGISAAGEQNKPGVLHETSPTEQDESATPRVLQQIQLDMEEMRRTFQLEMEERKRTSLLGEEGTQNTHQPQAGNQRHLGEVWKPGDDGPILARVGGANLPIDRGGTASGK